MLILKTKKNLGALATMLLLIPSAGGINAKIKSKEMQTNKKYIRFIIFINHTNKILFITSEYYEHDTNNQCAFCIINILE